MTSLSFWLPYATACFLLVAAIGVLIERHYRPLAERKDVRAVLFALGGDELSLDGIALVANIATGRPRKRLAKLLVRMEREGLVVSREAPLNWRARRQWETATLKATSYPVPRRVYRRAV